MRRPEALLAILVALAPALAGAQQDSRSTEHERYGDPGEGHFGDPSAGHFGSPPRQVYSDYEPVTVRPLKRFDSRYLDTVPEARQTLDSDQG